MIEFSRHVLSVLIGFGSGMVIAAAVFAFITVIGVVPRFAQKTNTQQHCRIYETAIAVGGIFGTIAGFASFRLPFGVVGAVIISLCVGIFYGCLAMSLAEVLDVMPILTRRGNIKRGLFFFVMAIAIGKFVGSMLYFLVPGFYEAGS
ncbi:MAG: stage V sporulation protein AB [Defluviitaleaceae bacterium]|nr:stage V sporulation protein AB [Defluviitaleaceae bacterium]